MQFIRYGSLVPQQHKSHSGESHEAPSEYGIYAFPVNYVEPFLLGGVGSGNLQNGRYKILRYKNGKKIKFNPDINTDICSDTKKRFEDINYTDEFVSLIKENYSDIDINKIQIYSEKKNKFIYLYRDLYEDYPEYKGEYFTLCIERKPNKFDYNGLIWSHLKILGKNLVKPGDIIQINGDWILTDMKTYEKGFKKYLHILNYSRNGNKVGIVPKDYYDKDWFEVFIEKVE